jgi:chemotaxis protein histidine kinase CheA
MTSGIKEMSRANHVLKGGMDTMNLVLNESEGKMVRNALETYVSNLREEIVKTEKHDWKKSLHDEEDTLKSVLEQLTAKSSAQA